MEWLKNNKAKTVAVNVASFLLIAMFTSFFLEQLYHFEQFQSKMQRQVFSPALSNMLSYVIPLLLVIATTCLIIPEKRHFGLLSATVLMLLFTGYVSAVLIGLFKFKPCACISIVKDISWQGQLFFNITFLFIAFSAFLLNSTKKRKTKNIIYTDRKGEGVGIGC